MPIRDSTGRPAVTGSASTTDNVSAGSRPTSSSATRHRPWLWTWIGLIVADIVIWLIADSQGPDLFAFNAQGSFLSVLKVAWAVSFLGFFLLISLGIVGLIRSQLRGRRSD